MKFRVKLYFFIALCTITSVVFSQAINKPIPPIVSKVGYYQTLDLNPETPCACDAFSDRHIQLYKALAPRDTRNYHLHAYSFSLGNVLIPASKLFKAFEMDNSVYKVSVNEWESLMLLTTADFDATSFEKAAKSIFKTFEPMQPIDFLRKRDVAAYQEYLQVLEKMKQVNTLSPTINH